MKIDNNFDNLGESREAATMEISGTISAHQLGRLVFNSETLNA